MATKPTNNNEEDKKLAEQNLKNYVAQLTEAGVIVIETNEDSTTTTNVNQAKMTMEQLGRLYYLVKAAQDNSVPVEEYLINATSVTFCNVVINNYVNGFQKKKRNPRKTSNLASTEAPTEGDGKDEKESETTVEIKFFEFLETTGMPNDEIIKFVSNKKVAKLFAKYKTYKEEELAIAKDIKTLEEFLAEASSAKDAAATAEKKFTASDSLLIAKYAKMSASKVIPTVKKEIEDLKRDLNKKTANANALVTDINKLIPKEYNLLDKGVKHGSWGKTLKITAAGGLIGAMILLGIIKGPELVNWIETNIEQTETSKAEAYVNEQFETLNLNEDTQTKFATEIAAAKAEAIAEYKEGDGSDLAKANVANTFLTLQNTINNSISNTNIQNIANQLKANEASAYVKSSQNTLKAAIGEELYNTYIDKINLASASAVEAYKNAADDVAAQTAVDDIFVGLKGEIIALNEKAQTEANNAAATLNTAAEKYIDEQFATLNLDEDTQAKFATEIAAAKAEAINKYIQGGGSDLAKANVANTFLKLQNTIDKAISNTSIQNITNQLKTNEASAYVTSAQNALKAAIGEDLYNAYADKINSSSSSAVEAYKQAETTDTAKQAVNDIFEALKGEITTLNDNAIAEAKTEVKASLKTLIGKEINAQSIKVGHDEIAITTTDGKVVTIKCDDPATKLSQCKTDVEYFNTLATIIESSTQYSAEATKDLTVTESTIKQTDVLNYIKNENELTPEEIAVLEGTKSQDTSVYTHVNGKVVTVVTKIGDKNIELEFSLSSGNMSASKKIAAINSHLKGEETTVAISENDVNIYDADLDKNIGA